MNRKIKEMTNVSRMQVPVLLEDGNSVYVQPGGVLRNVVVANLPIIKKFFQVVEDLNEVTKPAAPGTPKVEIQRHDMKAMAKAMNPEPGKIVLKVVGKPAVTVAVKPAAKPAVKPEVTNAAKPAPAK